jgi:3-oxoacyl-[acyl-carrier-protein] synthase-3
VLAIEDIAVHTPARRVALETDYERLRIDSRRARVYARMYGFDQIALAEPGEEFDMLQRAVCGVLAHSATDSRQVRLVLHAHTGPYIGPVGHSLPRQIARALGPHVRTFGMQLHKCVSSLTALHVAERLLRQYPHGSRAILLIGEAADSEDLRILDAGVVGDVGCAVLLTRDAPRDQVVASTVRVHGEYARGIYDDPSAPVRQDYDQRSRDLMVKAIAETLDRAQVSLADVRYVLPHNVNVKRWLRAIDALGVDRGRVYLDNVARYGHCFGADVFVNFAAVRRALQPGDYCLLVSAGVGDTYGATLIRH